MPLFRKFCWAHLPGSALLCKPALPSPQQIVSALLALLNLDSKSGMIGTSKYMISAFAYMHVQSLIFPAWRIRCLILTASARMWSPELSHLSCTTAGTVCMHCITAETRPSPRHPTTPMLLGAPKRRFRCLKSGGSGAPANFDSSNRRILGSLRPRVPSHSLQAPAAEALGVEVRAAKVVVPGDAENAHLARRVLTAVPGRG